MPEPAYTPTEDQVLRRICAVIAAGDPTAKVIPRWLAIEDGDDLSELRSEDDPDATGRPRIHAWMVEQTSPIQLHLVGSVPDYDESGETGSNDLPNESASDRRLDCTWPYKIGLWLGYEQGTDADNSTVRANRHVQEVQIAFATRPKLGLAAIKHHEQLEILRAYTQGFSHDTAHVRLGLLAVNLRQTITGAS